MLSYEIVKNKPTILLAMTSLNQTEFEQLLVEFERAWDAQPKKENRKRRAGGGRKPTLHRRAEQLFFILFYYKTYPLQSILGFLFGLSQAQANEWIHRLSEILKTALAGAEWLPERVGQQLADALAENESHTYAQDGCERQRQRPKDEEKQCAYYSGKKKVHTVKNHLVVHTESRRVEYLSETVAGKTHDKKMADEAELTFPTNATIEQDTGFQGYVAENALTIQPKKKPRKQELTIGEKFINRCISSGRVVVENVIAGVKRCRIVKDVFRNWKADFNDLVMLIACGLHNLRTTNRHSTQTVKLLDLYFR